MASTQSFDSAVRLEPRELPGRRFFTGLTTYLSAIREGRDAAHAYDELVRHGIPHDKAVERVFKDHFTDRR